MAQNEFAPVTPGEMLKEEFLTEYGLSRNRLAKAIGISPNRIAASPAIDGGSPQISRFG
jgi:plasmid maintenance system antidote protein VapI